MRVLEEVPWSLEITCTGCKSKLAAEKDDITAVEVDGGDYSDKTYYHCQCPLCETELDIEGDLLSKVPSGIRELAVQKSRTRRRGR